MNADQPHDEPFRLVRQPVKAKPWKPAADPARQRVLLAGLDCLPDQQDLFATDGESGDDAERTG